MGNKNKSKSFKLTRLFWKNKLNIIIKCRKRKKIPSKSVVDIGKVTISCTNQTGDAKEELFISTEGKNLEAGFNPKYFLDSLKVIDDEEVYVEFGSSISPCLIKSTENNDYVYMILPIRIKED